MRSWRTSLRYRGNRLEGYCARLSTRWWHVRILLDESRPRTLSKDLSDAVVETELDRGWSGLKHGELPERAAESFDLFVVADQNLP
jgi:hypothetical protein